MDIAENTNLVFIINYSYFLFIRTTPHLTYKRNPSS